MDLVRSPGSTHKAYPFHPRTLRQAVIDMNPVQLSSSCQSVVLMFWDFPTMEMYGFGAEDLPISSSLLTWKWWKIR